MTNEQLIQTVKEAMRQTAEKAKDNFMPNFMVPTRDVLALLDELEAAEKRIAELEARQVDLEHIGYIQVEEGTFYLDESMVKSAICAAGIGVKGE